MPVHNERPFEDTICDHLAANEWLYSANDAGYDAERALFPQDVFDWVADAFPDQWARLPEVTPVGRDPREHLLDSLVKRLDNYGRPDGGTLGVLRKDHRVAGRGKTIRFKMCQFAPSSDVNPALQVLHDKVRLRVVRQVHYSTRDRKSIDLVLFVNGLPVATLELKSDYTQSVDDAISQYRQDRHPGSGRTAEPLLTAGARALVHFAVSHDEVYMTTRLDGVDTIFLPFNLGRDDGAGNPPNPRGHRTAYLWEQVLLPHNWLGILGRFMHSEPLPASENMRGERRPKAKLLFPRYHQWDAVTKIVDHVKTHGTGSRYLVQHSAGSGKTNSIAWTAHALSTLHTADPGDSADPGAAQRKTYSSVIVLTDRTVLDDQLQRAIKEIDQSDGIGVTAVTQTEAARRGLGSKSQLLAKAINDGDPIVVTTIQTFPHALALMDAQSDRRFAILIDEAHQSQDGEAGRTVDAALARQEGFEWDPETQTLLDADGVEVSAEEFDTSVEATMAKRALADHVTYVAFTATPKESTLSLFGTTDPTTGQVAPFHLYTMKQAIEEGFILDVLQNYRAVDVSAYLDESGATDVTPFADRLVDGRRARRELNRRLYEDPDLIDAKAAWIVKHFDTRVAHLLGATAKAMVVTYSRRAAVRYLHAIQREAVAQRSTLSALVAFSGGVTEGGREETESTLNGTPTEPSDLFTAPDGIDPTYSVIVVANKYQTGFSEARLSAMYLDKPVSGINAVQTLSRLNRTLPSAGKDTVFLVDFTDRGEQMLKAFQRFYTEARLPEEMDPTQIYELVAALDDVGLYDDATVDGTARAALAGDQQAMDRHVGPVASEWQQRLAQAKEDEDAAEAALMLNFAANVSTFLSAYAFMSQVHDYSEAGLEKRHVFFSLLAKRFRRDPSQRPDLSGLTVTVLGIDDGDEASLGLTGDGEDSKPPEYPVSESDYQSPVEETLREIIDEFNNHIADSLGVDSDVATHWIESIVRIVLRDDTLRSQARDNDPEDFEDSLHLGRAVAAAVNDSSDGFDSIAGAFDDDPGIRRMVLGTVSRLAHHGAQGQ